MASQAPPLSAELEELQDKLMDRMVRNGDWNKWVHIYLSSCGTPANV
jgi:hypothetical protein